MPWLKTGATKFLLPDKELVVLRTFKCINITMHIIRQDLVKKYTKIKLVIKNLKGQSKIYLNNCRCKCRTLSRSFFRGKEPRGNIPCLLSGRTPSLNIYSVEDTDTLFQITRNRL